MASFLGLRSWVYPRHDRKLIAEVTRAGIGASVKLDSAMQLASKGLGRLPRPAFEGVAEIGGLRISQSAMRSIPS